MMRCSMLYGSFQAVGYLCDELFMCRFLSARWLSKGRQGSLVQSAAASTVPAVECATAQQYPPGLAGAPPS